MTDAIRNKLDKAMTQLEKSGYHFFGFMVSRDGDVEAFASLPCSPDDFAYNVVTCLQTQYPDMVLDLDDTEKGMVN